MTKYTYCDECGHSILFTCSWNSFSEYRCGCKTYTQIFIDGKVGTLVEDLPRQILPVGEPARTNND